MKSMMMLVLSLAVIFAAGSTRVEYGSAGPFLTFSAIVAMFAFTFAISDILGRLRKP